MSDVNVVLLSIPPNKDYPQNIFGLNEKGDVLWQVEPRPSTEPHNRYTSIRDEIGSTPLGTPKIAADVRSTQVRQGARRGANTANVATFTYCALVRGGTNDADSPRLRCVSCLRSLRALPYLRHSSHP